ncbi:hypothetical protein PsYK624_086440 [Phanerochaete sordida]|uniref:DUF6533 domain-containing protein n=1 Tax=Phanerochaete sordida TaxID=48140 RepID=A0A9P3GEV9_9APHY|nr:hypothetical protein PsYK624_086440 [Phanerochaete sordida]
MSLVDIPVPLVTAAEHGAAVKAMTLVGITALVYDHLLTLDQEIDLIWRGRPGFVSLIFLVNRYLVPCILIVDVYEQSGVTPSSKLFCQVWTVLQSYLTLASFMLIHAIVAIRVFALHNGRSWVRRFLWVSGTIYLLTTTVVITLGSVEVVSTLQPYHGACVGTMPWYLWFSWLPTVIFESILFMLTILALLNQEDCRSFSKLTRILYLDGLVYFAAVTICSTFSLMVWAFAPVTLNGLARYFSLAVVNVVSSRMVLNLKAYALKRRSVLSDDDLLNTGPSFGPSTPPTPLTSIPTRARRWPRPLTIRSADSSIDLEVYAIEREYQQLGTRLR